VNGIVFFPSTMNNSVKH